jgi:hypothetical protein
MQVRIEGTSASFDRAKQERCVAACRTASPASLGITIASVSDVTLRQRRLLASFVDVKVVALYANRALAEAAAANDLTEANLNAAMQAEGLGLVTIEQQPTVSSVGEDPSQTEKESRENSIAVWVIVVAVVGGVLLVGAVGARVIWLRLHSSKLKADNGRASSVLEDPQIEIPDGPKEAKTIYYGPQHREEPDVDLAGNAAIAVSNSGVDGEEGGTPVRNAW